MPAYVFYQGEVTDPERYEQYKTRAAASIIAAGGRYLVRGGDVHVFEGEAPAGRTVLLEFPDSEARSIRRGAATARMFLVDGVS